MISSISSSLPSLPSPVALPPTSREGRELPSLGGSRAAREATTGDRTQSATPSQSSSRPAPQVGVGVAQNDSPAEPSGSNGAEDGKNRNAPPESTPSQASGGETTADPTRLTEQEIQEIQELRAQDRLVRQHEQAHLAAGGPYVRGGPTYRFTTGPDGRQYAVAGEVSIDTSKEATPQQTLLKAQVIRRAALAPLEPSAQDRSVAALATQLEAQARQEISQANLEAGRATDTEQPSPTKPEKTEAEFEFTEIGPVPNQEVEDQEEEEAPPSDSTLTRTPIVSIAVPIAPEAQATIGQVLDLYG